MLCDNKRIVFWLDRVVLLYCIEVLDKTWAADLNLIQTRAEGESLYIR